VRGALEEIAREGARQLLQLALEAEVSAFWERYASLRDEHGRQRVVRNGRLPGREVLTGIGPLHVEQPRVRDRACTDSEGRIRFTSAILPR
jgi:hypothetical protein